MDATVITAIVSGAVAVCTAAITYMTAKNSTKKDLFVTDRQQLSQEQQQLRTEMREELRALKDEVKGWTNKYIELEGSMDEMKLTNLKLTMEVEKWKEKYDDLLQENEALQKRVGELEGDLKRRRNSNKE